MCSGRDVGTAAGAAVDAAVFIRFYTLPIHINNFFYRKYQPEEGKRYTEKISA